MAKWQNGKMGTTTIERGDNVFGLSHFPILLFAGPYPGPFAQAINTFRHHYVAG